jgi:hypothetical protein
MLPWSPKLLVKVLLFHYKRLNVYNSQRSKWDVLYTNLKVMASLFLQYFLDQKLHHSTLDSINRCRIYLQVITIADITSADGTYILPEVKLGQHPSGRKSTLQWPYQGRPAASDWITWRNSLLLLENRGKLAQPLGDWTMQPHQIWHTFLDITTSIAYKFTTG